MRKSTRMMAGLFAVLLLLTLSAFIGSATTGCTSAQDACKAFCRKAAECLQCGSTANLQRCENTCYDDLSIDEKKALGDCTGDCMTMRICPAFQQHPDLNPCRP